MYLDLLQNINDILYQILGASDIVINLQIHINQRRHNNDIVDKKEILLYDNEKPIVQ